MRSGEPVAPESAAATDRQNATIRVWAAWLLLAFAVVLAAHQAASLARPAFPTEVLAGGGPPAHPLFSLVGLLMIGAPLLAVLIATKGGEPVRSARAVMVVATG